MAPRLIHSQSAHPDHRAEIHRISRIIGQLEGVKRMIDEGVYCPEILVQTRAAARALRAVEGEILRRHLAHCVRGAIADADEARVDARIDEVVRLFKRDD